MGKLRFGILGTGNIARQFAEGVVDAKCSVITAVASRTQANADTFGKTHSIAPCYGNYESLLRDDAVDAVYVSLPNNMHAEWTIRALEAGKHVLCEKPIASNQAEAERMFDVAKKCGRVLIEAFMYRCHPQTKAIIEKVNAGAIGELRLIRTAFCIRVRNQQDNIRFKRELAGGALMDVGCYCLSFAQLLCGEPERVHAVGRLADTGVDVFAAGVMQFPGGVAAEFSCALDTQTDNRAFVCGTEGYLEIPWLWKPQQNPSTFILNAQIPPRQDAKQQRRPREDFKIEVDRSLYALEADAFAACVFDGDQPFMTREESLGNMRLLDSIRQQVGVLV